ncbi:MAG: peptidoglycan-binding protein [Burkholderiales bacterium RIFCSPLOWO2_02_FULL_57_36]|nr:MAG: peptidoglycan-binding protein [Burkholderiales bacterium RIFCSPLOWO2_02_FULL_57_36]
MYSQFFRLDQAPFSIAPDPRYLFMSERHREALAHLLYGVDGGGGFVLLTGEIGAGKTTICRCFLEQIPANCNVAYIFNPKLTVNELLRSICDEFGIVSAHQGPGQATVKDYVDALNAYLLRSYAEGRNNVLIIDEAQNLSADVLEQLRLLTNLETNERKLLQIILIGQPELRTMLARPELEQLAQRVIARYHLDSLSEPETASYISHRLAVAGLIADSPFPQKMMRRIHRLTAGVPRRINLLCDRALLGAYAEGKRKVDRPIVAKAAHEVFDSGKPVERVKTPRWRYAALGLMLIATFLGAAAWIQYAGASFTNLESRGGKLSAAMPEIVEENLSEPMPQPAQATTVAPAAPTALADVNELMNGNASDENTGYRELAKLWNVALGEGESCEAAKNANLHCYKGNGGLAEIRRLDRPAMLVLRDTENMPHYALLTGLTNTGATLRLKDVDHAVNLLALGRSFQGEFTTFWYAPNTYRTILRAGDQGADVDWLMAQFSKMNGVKEPPPNQVFDQAMIKQVREFQVVQGLEADGVVGPQTFMHLNNSAGIKEPRLQHATAAMNAASEK